MKQKMKQDNQEIEFSLYFSFISNKLI
jgi:hypothetical protein